MRYYYTVKQTGYLSATPRPCAPQEPQGSRLLHTIPVAGVWSGEDIGMTNTPETFWKRVTKTESCWPWRGFAHKKTGYGRFNYLGGQYYAHRVSWLFSHGEIPIGLDVLHHCDNPPCVRPDHLFLGTQTDNNADRDAKGRGRWGINRRKKIKSGDICRKGHLYRASSSGRIYCYDCESICKKTFRIKHGFWPGRGAAMLRDGERGPRESTTRPR
jgi:hypothetical protein